MDEVAIPTPKARWWHSRRKRKRVLLPVYLALVASFCWQAINDQNQTALRLFLMIGAVQVAEWLWFRFLDPNYPSDDSSRQSERSFLWPEDQSWWQSRFRRREILWPATIYCAFALGLALDRPALWVFGVVLYHLTDWIWFRFFDPAYPDDDLAFDPVTSEENFDAMGEVLFWLGVLATALLIFGLLHMLLSR